MAYVSQKDKAKLAPEIKKVLSKYGMKGSISIRHHMSLVVTIQSGAIEFEHSHGDGYTQVNVYHIDSHYTGKAKAFLTELLAAMKGPEWFDKSDIMTDYFHVSHYCDINIGKWNKPYFLQNTAKKAPKKPVQASKTIKVPAKATFSNAVEDVARMTNAERDKFVEDMIASYPNLADDLLTKIGFGLMDAENG
tara:strand:+ start:1041 stop:1616 length:576 start_codon:yes stop_codon:yes gene_type:complete